MLCTSDTNLSGIHLRPQHTCRHVHTHTRARSHTRTRAHAHTRTRAHAHTRTRAHEHTRTRAHAHTRTRAHAHTHTQVRNPPSTLRTLITSISFCSCRLPTPEHQIPSHLTPCRKLAALSAEMHTYTCRADKHTRTNAWMRRRNNTTKWDVASTKVSYYIYLLRDWSGLTAGSPNCVLSHARL